MSKFINFILKNKIVSIALLLLFFSIFHKIQLLIFDTDSYINSLLIFPQIILICVVFISSLFLIFKCFILIFKKSWKLAFYNFFKVLLMFVIFAISMIINKETLIYAT